MADQSRHSAPLKGLGHIKGMSAYNKLQKSRTEGSRAAVLASTWVAGSIRKCGHKLDDALLALSAHAQVYLGG